MKVGITFSTFDLFHAGHVHMLSEAKKQCDYLIVGLQIDPTIDRPTKNKPIQTIVERFIQVDGSKFVDRVIPYSTEEDLLELLSVINPNIRFLGDEYRDKEFTGKTWCVDNGCEIVYLPRKHRYSSSSLRRVIAQSERDFIIEEYQNSTIKVEIPNNETSS